MFSYNILNFQEFTTILDASTKKVWKLIEDITYDLVWLSFMAYQPLKVI